jgi:hypothetical protein
MRIAVIADSPKLSTGFANVSRPVCEGFVKAGFEVFVFGILDWTPDTEKQLPYPFWPSSPIDPMGKEESIRFVKHIQPDIVWIMIDPGNLLSYAINLIELNKNLIASGQKGFKILAYPPVEGRPLSMFQATAIKHIMDNKGKVVLWCKSAVEEVKRWIPEYDFDYIYFGNDHLKQPLHTPEEIKVLRSKVGLDKYFIAGAFGVNKRTKGFPTLIYAATYLKQWGYEDKIKFYCHTDPANPTMQGHHLVDMADRYGVRKMFLWKPDNNQQKRGNPYLGDDRSNGTYERVSKTKKPRTPQKRMQLWESYDFTSKLDCMDMYADTSQVEGWGLPQLEAMSRGIPLMSIHDCHVRDELYGTTAHMLNPLPPDLWDTWHTGARLVTIDPQEVAKGVVHFYEDRDLGNIVSERGLVKSDKFKWEYTQQEMNKKIMELYNE